MESYPRARLHGMRWVLVEATDRVLPEIDAAARRLRAARAARARYRHPPRDDAGGGRAPTAPASRAARRCRPRTVVWTAGVAPQPILDELNLPLDERGRVPVDEHLRVKGMDSVWAIGDCAAAPDPARRHLPADRPARGPPGPGGGAQHRRRARDRRAAAASSTAATPPSSTSAATRRSAGSATGPSAASPPGGWPAATT